MISSNLTKELLDDRIKFKLYAAEKHLKQLKRIDKKHGNILKDRINAEIQIDCFFAEVIGAKDSLLVRINKELSLGIDDKDVDLDEIYIRLKLQNKEHLLKELRMLSSKKGSWYWLLNELRNHSLHRAMLNKQVSMGIIENINYNTTRSTKPQVAFLINPLDKVKRGMNESVIEYLEESLNKMQGLIGRIRRKSGF